MPHLNLGMPHVQGVNPALHGSFNPSFGAPANLAYFFVRLGQNVETIPSPRPVLPFSDVVLNYGHAYNNGYFTAPQNGIYSFMVSLSPFRGHQAWALLKKQPFYNSTVSAGQRQGGPTHASDDDEPESEVVQSFTCQSGLGGSWMPFSTNLMLQLNHGDKLWMEVAQPPLMAHYTHFGGYLLHAL